MLKIAGWTVGILAGLLLLALAVGWLVLQSSAFSGLRRDLVQSALSEQIGQPLVIEDDVRMQARRRSTVYLGRAIIPSENINGINLAELETASFKIDLFKLFQGKFDLDELEISQLHVNLLRKENGTTSWTREDIWGTGARSQSPDTAEDTRADADEDEAAEKAIGEDDLVAAAKTPQTGFFNFLNGKTVHFDDIRLTVDNRWTGFEFDFLLGELALEQEDGDIQTLAGNGTLNDRPFEITGKFPKGQAFDAAVRMGEASLTVDGVPFPEDRGQGYEATAVFDPGSLGDLLETIGLKRSFDGIGRIEAKITATPEALSIDSLDAGAEFASGQSLSITGGIADVMKLAGIDLAVDAILQPRDAPVAPATRLSEIRLVDLDGRIVSAPSGVRLEELQIQTNAFKQDLRQIGPVSIDRIHRTQDGELSLIGIDVQIGPEGSPVIEAVGDVTDIFAFKGVNFEGKIDASADLVLKRLDPEDIDEFGSLKGEFAVSDASGNLAITGFKGYSYGTELWKLDVEFSATDITTLTGLDLRFDLGVADGKRFLEALRLKPIDGGQIGFSGTIEGDGADLSATAMAVIKQSQIAARLSSQLMNDKIIARGGIDSAEIHIVDLRDVVGSAVQIQSLLTKKGKVEAEPEIQPLVIETKQEESKPEEELLPLVIEEKAEEAQLVSKRRFLDRLDLELGIDIARIVGQEGISGVRGDLSLKQGTLQLGPVEASYGGGNFNATATTNLLEDNKTLHLAGTTAGWDFGEILDSVGLGIDAYGALSGNFDLSGSPTSAKSFLSSMNGNATIRMHDGRIATSLIELAGLGIFKWLFSEERRQGYTDIVCVNAPVRISAGSVSSDTVVAETQSVQVKVAGRASWVEDSISLRVEPRPVGKSFARSPFPAEISGKLTEPKFQILFAGAPGEGPRPLFGAQQVEDHEPCVLDR